MSVATGEAARPVRKGRPRNEQLDEAITSTALEVLADVGFEGFSVEEVASRAGVAKTTVYRRFPCRGDLVVGALARLNQDLPPAPPDGPVRDRLVHLLTDVRRRTPQSERGRILMHAAAEAHRDPRLADLVQQRVLAPRQTILRAVVQDGIDAGELRADLDLDVIVPVLVGPMIYLGVWGATEPAQRVTVEAVVDSVLSGLTRATGS